MASSTPISADDLRRLSSGRWVVPILAVMSRDGGSRFSALLRQLGLSRSVLSNHLDLLERFGWIARNAGHGHPLRPEYLLTAGGRPIAAWSERLMAQRKRIGLEPHSLGRWSLPLLSELTCARRRFSELQRGLRPITPRALTLAIDQMLDIQMVDRRSMNHVQSYGLTARGMDFAAILQPAR
jgi:DNA-binding HxlR family transcriptional regulator